MAITFIDNQPIRFNSAKFDDQSCINKDLSGYSVLMQPGDPLFFQFKQYCCEDNLVCQTDDLGAELVTNGDFAGGGSWTTSLGTEWVIGAGVATYTAIGDGDALIQSGLAISVGGIYKISIDIVTNTTGYQTAIRLGRRVVKYIEANATGTFTFWGTAGSEDTIIISQNLGANDPSTGELVIDNVSVKRTLSCYVFDTETQQYITNGTFTGSATGWTLGTGWAWNAGNFVRHTAGVGNNENLSQTISDILHGEDVLIEWDMANRTAGNILFGYSGFTTSNAASTNGVGLSEYVTFKHLQDSVFFVLPQTTFDGDLDNIQVTKVFSGWNYDDVNGFCHDTGWAAPFYNNSAPLTIGRFYKMTIQVSMTEGSLVVVAGGVTLGTVTESGIYKYYFTALTTAGEKFTPSSDFDGCILPDMELCQLRRDYEFRLIYENGAGATDWHTEASSQDAVVYSGDWVTWSVTSLASVLSGGIPVALPYSCYKMQVNDFCAGGVMDSVQFTSDTSINYQLSHPCTKRIRAWADGESLGFNFGDNGNLFILVQRFRTLYMNPSYPNSGEDYEYSTGTIKRIFAKTEKRYEMLFDYMDEYAHDTMGNGMIPCDIFEIDGVEYLVVFKDYEPNWAERGKRNLAQSTIEIQKRIEKVLFNRNCS